MYETSLPPLLYVSREHLLADVLRPSPTTTYCPYKGTATYWSAFIGDDRVPDVAWSYEAPNPECWAIRGHFCFAETNVGVETELPAWPGRPQALDE